MNIRTRSSRTMSRSRRTPQYRARMGNAIAPTPIAPFTMNRSSEPNGPPEESHSASTDSSATTTSPMPKASRAHGERCDRSSERFRFRARLRVFRFANPLKPP